MMGWIYVLENTKNKKCYIGQTTRFLRQRLSFHRDRRNQSVIAKAIRKYGWDSFKKYKYCIQDEMLNEVEIEMISKLKSFGNGYNMTRGGEGNWHHSDETKKRMSISRSGERNHNFGKNFSEEYRQHISESHKGIRHKEETKQKIKMNTTGSKNHAFGKKKSLEQRRKISQSKIGQHRGDHWKVINGKRVWLTVGAA